MTENSITCGSCGAKLRLREGVDPTHAKCPKCGERVARPKAAATTHAKAHTEAAGHAGGTRAHATHAHHGSGAHRAHHHHAPPKSKLGLWLGVGAAVVVVGVLAVVLSSGGETSAKAQPSAAAPEGARPDTATGLAETPAVETPPAPAPAQPVEQAPPTTPPAAEAQQPREPASPPSEPSEPKVAPVAEASPPAPAPAPDAAAKPAAAPPKPALPTGKRIITSPDQVTNPKKLLEPMPYPADTTEEEKQAMQEALATLRSDTGAPGRRAGKRLMTYGHKGLIAIVNQLRELDYLMVSDSMYAEDLNLLLKDMLKGANAGFKGPKTIEEGNEKMDLQTADYNAQTVLVWFQEAVRWDTKEEYEAWLKERSKVHEAPEEIK